MRLTSWISTPRRCLRLEVGVRPAVQVFAACLVLLGTSILISCIRRSQAPDDKAVEEVFRSFYSPVSNVTASLDLDVYVDGSMSMRGFATRGESNYSRITRELLQSATAAQFNLNVYKFAETITPITRLPLTQLQSPEFYNGRDTPLSALLTRLAQSPSHSAMVVSDLVQSEGGVDSLGLVKALTHLADLRPHIKLLAYRSTFDGLYYPESGTGGHKAFSLRVSQSLPGSGRPFYLLVVAPDAQSMKRVDDYVLSRIPAVQAFNPTGPPLVVDTVELMTDGSKNLVWSLYARPVLKQTLSPRRIESAFRIKSATSEQRVLLPVVFRTRSDVPIRDPSRLEWDAVRACWRGEVGFDKPAQVEVPLSGDLDSSGQRLRLRVNLRRPEANAWDVYFVKMSAGDANLGAPAWVTDWNTENDSDPVNGNRTFQLNLIVESMLNAISEHVVFCEYVLEVGREE